jgi:hypothetical protein
VLNHSSTILITSSLFLLMLLIALAGISLLGKINSCAHGLITNRFMVL